MGQAVQENRMQWFEEARFGMFIHWGVYACAGKGEWLRSDEFLSTEDYEPYVRMFHPEHCDMKSWARLAREAGMKYAVFTAKHHDGYCMFDSAYTEYQSYTKTGHDYVREFVDAFRSEGLKVGLYYSLIDWHHPDYPHYGDKIHPERNNVQWKNYPHVFDRYLEYMHAQIRELCTKYGTIDIFWTDYSYDEMRAETWKGSELVKMVRSLQPDIILNNRLEASGEGFGSLIEENPKITSGDFVSPEQIIPPNGIIGFGGKHVPWEACITMNRHWGYCESDHWFKPAGLIIRKLVECVSKGGNLLVNIGPDKDGQIPLPSCLALKEIGAWMAKNGESIYGCKNSVLPKPEYGRITEKAGYRYYHVLEPLIGGVPLTGTGRSDIDRIILLEDQREIPCAEDWITSNYPDLVFADLGEDPNLPDPVDTVLKVCLKK